MFDYYVRDRLVSYRHFKNSLLDIRQQCLSEVLSDSSIPPLKKTVFTESLSPFIELTLFRNIAGAQPSSP